MNTSEDWLATWAQHGLPREQALARFDSLPSVAVQELTGRWRGSGLPTGHSMDGLLELYSWYGKSFAGSEEVHPLLFRDARGEIYAFQPAVVPMQLALVAPGLARLRPLVLGFKWGGRLLRTKSPSARLRLVEHRGVSSAAMIYDRLPIIDHFRRVDDDRLLGLMDLRYSSQPFFFLLARDVEFSGLPAG